MGKTILVVDDDQDLLRGLSIRLKANGFQVTFAADAMYAVSIARKEHPDLIILDIGLPGGDGFMVMDKLKSNSALSSIPIIILSARDPQVNREKALEHGAVAFLQKPADNFVLMTTIQKILGDTGHDEPKPKAQPVDEFGLTDMPINKNIVVPVPNNESFRNAPEIDDTPHPSEMPAKVVNTAAELSDDTLPDSGQAPSHYSEAIRNKFAQSREKPKKQEKNILVVDDDHDLLLGMSVRLMAYGYNVFFTYDVVSAIAKAKKVNPDLIILDIGLPGGDGFTVMERMKKIPSIAEIPVIVLTAREPRKNRQKALEMGAIGFFQKPANNSELISAIRKVLR